jgi:hypothetical protein
MKELLLRLVLWLTGGKLPAPVVPTQVKHPAGGVFRVITDQNPNGDKFVLVQSVAHPRPIKDKT